jgi:hypothetical protein
MGWLGLIDRINMVVPSTGKVQAGITRKGE